MPPTFRAMRVGSNVEAGIKYLGQLTARFGREDYALAGYNGGPTRVGRGGPMPLESLQYVLGVGTYRTVLKLHEESLRAHARDLTLVTVGADDDWWRLSQRAGIPTVQLRLHNPFIAARGLRAGQRIAVPRRPRTDLFASPGLDPEYRVRLGDNALTLAFTLGIEPDRFREVNGLWRLQTLLPGNVLTIPLDRDGLVTTHRVSPGEDLGLLARRFNVDPWSIVRDNGLWDDRVEEGALLRIRTGVRAPAPRPAQPRTHVVRRGETLTAIAARYETTIPAIQSANALGRRTRILVGQRLRIPPG
jgi:LysM repeat protein